MKITIYELLGLIKDGKAPKKIKYDGMIWILKETPEDYDYYNEDEEYLLPFLDEYITIHFALTDILRWEVEILDKEYIGKESIEKTIKFLQAGMKHIAKEKELINKYSKDEFEDIEEVDVEYDNDGKLSKVINQLIKNQKKIIDKLSE